MSVWVVNVEAAMMKNGKWLVIKRSVEEAHAAGKLSLVGGKVEAASPEKDLLEKNLHREVLEEVGVEVKAEMEYVHSSSFISDEGEAVINIVFLCEVEKGEAQAKNTSEIAAVFWLTEEEISNHPGAPDYLKAAISHAQAIKNSDRDWHWNVNLS